MRELAEKVPLRSIENVQQQSPGQSKRKGNSFVTESLSFKNEECFDDFLQSNQVGITMCLFIITC